MQGDDKQADGKHDQAKGKDCSEHSRAYDSSLRLQMLMALIIFIPRHDEDGDSPQEQTLSDYFCDHFMFRSLENEKTENGKPTGYRS